MIRDLPLSATLLSFFSPRTTFSCGHPHSFSPFPARCHSLFLLNPLAGLFFDFGSVFWWFCGFRVWYGGVWIGTFLRLIDD